MYFNFFILEDISDRNMKVLILGAGYGTRMEKDLKEHDSDEYRSLIGVPKPLLPIGKYALITHWMKLLKDVENVTDIYVVVCIGTLYK